MHSWAAIRHEIQKEKQHEHTGSHTQCIQLFTQTHCPQSPHFIGRHFLRLRRLGGLQLTRDSPAGHKCVAFRYRDPFDSNVIIVQKLLVPSPATD